MNPIRPNLMPALLPLAPAEEVARPSLPIHEAVARRDSQQVEQLRSKGLRANELDSDGRSPMDLLDTMRDIDERSRSGLRMALLQSLNPTAPVGYMKPEALHGTPWGLEILQAGALKGGVNDPKGGSQSLEGKVFFSDRTQEKNLDTTTRPNLRTKPRMYAAGNGTYTSNASSRAQQHRMTQFMLTALNRGKPLNTSLAAYTIGVDEPKDIRAQGAAWLQNFLHDRYILIGAGKALISASLDDGINSLKFPNAIHLKTGEHIKELKGAELYEFYHQAASDLQSELEDGKAPYLGMLNQGAIVPVVFGFEKVDKLSTHEIQGYQPGDVKKFAYQNGSHPLSGGTNGGKLKEIEVRSLEDFATLCLACAAKGITLPGDVLVRLKAKRNVKAEYLDVQKVESLRGRIAEHLAAQTNGESLAVQSMERLQGLNTGLRAADLSGFYG